ncbi:MAG: hypothetical protein Q8K62_11150 [Thiobacillus sp.]|nr:hypothetical protein [Thiobacillus sp.]
MTPKRFFTIFAFLIFCNNSLALDVPQYDRTHEISDDTNVIGIECNKKTKTLEIGYFQAYNLPGKEMDLWDTFDLKTNSKNGDYVQSVHELTRKCNIEKDQYLVKIRPVPGNWNLNGRCGGRTYGGATIFKNGVKIFDGNFQECESKEIITRIIISPGEKLLVIKEAYKD